MSCLPQELPHLRIGSVDVGFPVVLAALAGYGDWPARVIATRLGAPYTIAEVMLDQFVLNVSRGGKARRYLRVTDEAHPCGAQLMGSAGEACAPAACRLAAAGFDVIDINFGCPVKKVLGKCRGGYLLSQPTTALEIVARVRDALPAGVPLTLKMRRGFDGSQRSRDGFFQIVEGAFRLGVAAVTVHGRTVQQRYEGRSSWEFLREVKQHVGDHTVLGSGDLFTARDCLDMLAQTGIDGVTVARGAIGNPWIFRQVRALAAAGSAHPVGRLRCRSDGRPPSLSEQREVLAEHWRLAEATYGPQRCPRLMRKFGIKYSRLHPQPEQLRDAFVAVDSAEAWWAVLDTWYRDPAAGD